MKKDFLEIGKIVSTHGIKGDVRIQPWADSPDELKKYKVFYCGQNKSESLTVQNCRIQGNMVLLKIKGIDSVETANTLRNKIIYISRKDADTDDGRFYIDELIGCTVFDADTMREYGIITDVDSYAGRNDVWVITDKNKNEFLFPALSELVVSVDIDKETVFIKPMKGIFEDED